VLYHRVLAPHARWRARVVALGALQTHPERPMTTISVGKLDLSGARADAHLARREPHRRLAARPARPDAAGRV